MGMSVKEIQIALAAQGYRPGAIDGVWGRNTAAAVRAFQMANGLDPDGIIGPLTIAKLFAGSVAPATNGLDDPLLTWFQEARRLMGTREVNGPENNPVILQWADNLDIHYAGDDVPWCGLFVGHCIASTLDREPLPPGLLSARSWARFGIRSAPMPGAVMVFWRGSRDSWQGHVGFYAGEDKTAYRILGGNQSDSVSLAWIAKDRLLDARWPGSVAPRPLPKVEIASRTGPLSVWEA